VVVDGHSVLFSAEPLRRGAPRPGRKSQADLVGLLQQVQDHAGVRVAVVFDGDRGGSKESVAPGEVEVRYAGRHQTADALIERAVAGCREPAAVTVVTGDAAETSALMALGADVISVPHFFELVRETCPEWVWTRWQTRAD
jgi:predicted RNA-binding protein with PIN domain